MSEQRFAGCDPSHGPTKSQDDLLAAYDAGFEASGEGWNGEYPSGAMDEPGYKMRRAQWIAHLIMDAPVSDDAGLHAPPGYIPMPRNADEAKAMWLLGEHWVRANAPEMIVNDATGQGEIIAKLNVLRRLINNTIAGHPGLESPEDHVQWLDIGLCRAEKMVTAIAQGMEARSAETLGSARKGDSPVGLPMRKNKAAPV